MMVGPLVVLLALAAVVPGQRNNQPTPTPIFVPPPPKGLGYYLMSGNRIVSQPFANVSDCFKTLAKIKATMQPGTDTLVCVHRAP
jgi:hypothetical protein